MSAGGAFDRDRLGELFEHALSLPPASRREFLEDACQGEPELRRELESLLDVHARSPDRLERLAEEVIPAALHAVPDATCAVGQIVSHYQVEEVIGAGGMGVVYRARDLALDRPVALKFLHAHLTGDAGARALLEAEARAASLLDHPNIAVVYEIGTAAPPFRDGGGTGIFIAMAYYAGETIREKLSRGPLAIADACRYATGIAAGLACAHDAGIVHRDVKPANVIVTVRGDVKIVDFGIARSARSERTRPGVMPGTVAYMSPEQSRGEPVDHRTDAWSLGALLYEMLTGQRPFQGADHAALIHAIRHDEPRPLRRLRPDVPDALTRVVERCLAKDPGARYQQTGELLAALQAVEPVAVPALPARRRIRVPRGAAALVTLFGLTVAASAVVLIHPDTRASLLGPAGDTAPDPVATAPAIAVLPFTPATDDPALARLGRELAVTLTAGLDGMGALRTVDALAMLDRAPAGTALSPDGARRLAEQLPADRFVHGALTRSGAGIRVDLSLYETGRADATVRTSATADDLATLTDAAIVALLDALWELEPPHAPSLAAVKRSQVPAARRAYLEGELALTRLDMAVALDAFERAFAEDPTFWWAYWRSLYPRTYREAREPADPALLQQVVEHRYELPLADRLLVEVWATPSRSKKLILYRELTDQFPDYSPAWWSYANLLTHYGGYLGRPVEETRAALEHFLALSPQFAAGWNHLVGAALVEGDSTAAARAALEEERWTADGTRRRVWTPVQAFRIDVSRTRVIPPERLAPAIDLMRSSPPELAEALTSGLIADGSAGAQIQLNRAMRERGASGAMLVALWRGEALAWAARGAWDEAITAADRWAAASGGREGALGAYRLAIAGVMIGGVPAREAAIRRPAIDRDFARWSSDERAGLGWLDGLLAYLARDAIRIEAAREAVAASGSQHSARLERSLAAFATDIEGDRRRAAREIADLETEMADSAPVHAIGARYPLFAIANRLLAARWLRSLGHDAEAARLLAWYESMANDAVAAAWNMGIGRIDLVDRGEIAESGGHGRRARRCYERFLQLYDRAVPAMRPLVDRATAGLERLGVDVVREPPDAPGPVAAMSPAPGR
jgi:serine/threonine protein kinase